MLWRDGERKGSTDRVEGGRRGMYRGGKKNRVSGMERGGREGK